MKDLRLVAWMGADMVDNSEIEMVPYWVGELVVLMVILRELKMVEVLDTKMAFYLVVTKDKLLVGR